MVKLSFRAWFWKEFKKFVSESSLKAKISISIVILMAILSIVFIGDNKDVSNDDNKETHEKKATFLNKEKTSESTPGLMGKLRKGKQIYKSVLSNIHLASTKGIPIGEPILIGVMQNNDIEGIVVCTDPLNIANGGLIIHLESYPGKLKAGKLLILEIGNSEILEIGKSEILINEVIEDTFSRKLQQTSYAIQH